MDFETVGVRLTSNCDAKLVIIGLYRSPNGCINIFFERLDSLLKFFDSKKVQHIVIGDFNIDGVC